MVNTSGILVFMAVLEYCTDYLSLCKDYKTLMKIWNELKKNKWSCQVLWKKIILITLCSGKEQRGFTTIVIFVNLNSSQWDLNSCHKLFTELNPLQLKMCHPSQSVFKQHPEPAHCFPWGPPALWSSHIMRVWMCFISGLIGKQRKSLLQSEKKKKCISSIPGDDTDTESVSDVVGGQTDRDRFTERETKQKHTYTFSTHTRTFVTSCH